MIQLIGPGGAGKTTIGAVLAERLGVRFIDLDGEFISRHGDISTYIDDRGYTAYASANLDVFSDLAVDVDSPHVVALSSGFMTYRDDVHPDYLFWRQRVAASASTFVLLPSLQLEACVQETVRRQLKRSFARSAKREEQVIRARFAAYLELPGYKVETMRPIDAAVAEIHSVLRGPMIFRCDGRPIIGCSLGTNS